MEMTGERRIPASRQAVWDALNDPETLKACIQGCDKLEKISDTEMQATVAMKIGPISARFGGKVTLSELNPPNRYVITGEGQGGVAGFGKGGAAIRLTDADDGTLLIYDVKAQVGGKIAQLGARLVDATAKQMADIFFDRFTARLTTAAPPPVLAEPAALEPVPVQPTPIPVRPDPNPAVAPVPRTVGVIDLIPPAPYGIPIIGWIVGGIALIGLLSLLGKMFL